MDAVRRGGAAVERALHICVVNYDELDDRIISLIRGEARRQASRAMEIGGISLKLICFPVSEV